MRDDVVNTIVDWLPVSPEGTQNVEDAITSIATPVSAVGLISLVLFAWAASGMMTAIRQGLETAMQVTESRPMAHGKLIDLVLIVGAAVLVLVTAGLTLLGKSPPELVGELRRRRPASPPGTLVGVLLHAAAFGLSVVVVLLLYRFVPARGLSIRDGLAGAIVTGLLLQLIALASAWTYERATKLSVVYGSLDRGARLPLLHLPVLRRVAARRGGRRRLGPPPPTEPAPPIRTQVKDAVLGLFVRPKEMTRRTRADGARRGNTVRMLPQPDDEVVRRAQRGDVSAFTELVRAYEEPVFNYVLAWSAIAAWPRI